MIGNSVSRYRIVEKLGEGGMGVVYKAEDTKLKRTVALKVPPPQALGTDDEKERFVQEAQAAAALDHPSICTIYEIDEFDGQTFISMAYCEGQDLKDKIEKGPLRTDTALDLAIQIAEGLQAAHEKGIIHRDVKSGNVIVNEHGRVKILDFGLAKLVTAPQAAKERQTAGTVAYMSPEQTRGDSVDGRSDIWSLGIVIYEMLTGRLPFRGDYEQSVIYAIVNEDPEPISALRSGIPEELERITAKMLAKSPKHRYQNVGDLLLDLRLLKAEIDSKELLSQKAIRVTAHRGRFKTFAIPTLVLVLVVLAAFVAYLQSGRREAIGAQIPIAVADFVNETGEPELDGLSGMLITSLEQSRRLSVLTRSRMYDVLDQMGRGDVDRIDENLGRAICREANINVLVVASIRKFDALYTIDLKAYDINNQDHLVTVKEQGEGRASIPSMIDKIAQKTRKGLKENSVAIAATSEPIADVTTPNLEAYQHYFAGEQHINRLEFDEAKRAFHQAIELDSTFALAHYRLAYANWWSHESEEIQRAQLEKALALIDHLPEKHRFLLRAQNAVLDHGYKAGIKVLGEMKKIYPDEKEMIYNLGDFSFHAEHFDEAAAYLERVLAMDPDDERALNHLTMTYIATKEKEKAIAVAKRYAERTSSDEAYLALTNAHLIDGDTDGALSAVTEARNTLPNSPLIEHQFATVQCMRDGFETARSILDSLVAEDQPEKILRMGYQSLYGANLYMGRYREALAHLERGMKLASYDPERADSVAAVLHHQMRGIIYLWGWNDKDNAEVEFQIASDIKKELGDSAMDPKETRDYWANFAIFHLMNDELDRANEIARKELSGDRNAVNRIRFFTYWKTHDYDNAQAAADTLLAEADAGQRTIIRYYLAQSQMEHGQYDEAIASLKNLQTDVHYSGPRPIFYVPSYYLLARVYEQKGDTNSAIENYGKFLEFWRNADADLLLLKDAKTRLANLESSATQ